MPLTSQIQAATEVVAASGGAPAVVSQSIAVLNQPVPANARRWLDYLTDAVAILCATGLLMAHQIDATVWSGLVIGILTGRAALRIPTTGGGLPPSTSAIWAILGGIAALGHGTRSA